MKLLEKLSVSESTLELPFQKLTTWGHSVAHRIDVLPQKQGWSSCNVLAGEDTYYESLVTGIMSSGPM